SSAAVTVASLAPANALALMHETIASRGSATAARAPASSATTVAAHEDAGATGSDPSTHSGHGGPTSSQQPPPVVSTLSRVGLQNCVIIAGGLDGIVAVYVNG